MFNIVWIDALRAAARALFGKEPERPAQKHDWTLNGDNPGSMVRYRLSDGVIRAYATPYLSFARVTNHRGETTDFIDMDSAVRAIAEAYP